MNPVLGIARELGLTLSLVPTGWVGCEAAVPPMSEIGRERNYAPQQKPARFIGRIERGFDFLGYHFSPAKSLRDSPLRGEPGRDDRRWGKDRR
jgi:hypothetical protein